MEDCFAVLVMTEAMMRLLELVFARPLKETFVDALDSTLASTQKRFIPGQATTCTSIGALEAALPALSCAEKDRVSPASLRGNRNLEIVTTDR